MTIPMTSQPLWMLLPWAVFAVAAGLKFWRLTAVFRRQRDQSPDATECHRKTLERIWQNGQTLR